MTKDNRIKCFVMQPFGSKVTHGAQEPNPNDDIYKALKKLEKIRPGFPIDVYRADTQSYAHAELHTHVIKCIERSDFAVADFSGRNSNVLYETGFARGIGREVIGLCRDRADVPSDLTELITVPYRMDDLEHLAADIDQHIDRVKSSIDNLRSKTDNKIKYFQKRDDSFIRSKISMASNRIDILQTNLTTIAANDMLEILEALRKNDELHLRILTLNPQSIFVNFRGQQLGFDENIGLYRGELESALKGVHYLLNVFGKRSQIRIYDDFPTQIGFRFDDDILACVVSATARSRENCAFLLPASLPGAELTFTRHFEYLWEEKNKKSVAYTPG